MLQRWQFYYIFHMYSESNHGNRNNFIVIVIDRKKIKWGYLENPLDPLNPLDPRPSNHDPRPST